MVRLLPPEISAHFTRIGGYEIDEVPASSQMQGMGEASIDDALHLIAGVRPDLVLYGCTSATLTHGLEFDQVLVSQIKSLSGAKAITAAGALITALQAINATKIGFASPYVGDVNDKAVRFLSDAGFETVNHADIGRALSSHEQGALTPDDVFDLAVLADHPDADAIVMACTDLRAVEVIKRIEVVLGKPVISSNQAMVYTALKALGIKQNTAAHGRLFLHL